MRKTLLWLSRLLLLLYIACVAIGVVALVVGFTRDSLAAAPLLFLGMPWTMAAGWITASSPPLWIGLALVATTVLVNVTILYLVSRRLSRP